MAQIEQSDGGKKKKGAQKKMSIHVDFTPMVDMNMLLITFFMLCTTMIKSQTLSIMLPAPPEENQQENNAEKVADTRSITLILDTHRESDGTVKNNDQGKFDDVVYYYEGQVSTKDGKFYDVNGKEIPNPLQVVQFIGNEGTGADAKYHGIREVLRKKNADVVRAIEEQKKLWRNGQITDEQFNAKRDEIANNKTDFQSAQVSIKATDAASWNSLISALDEMQINAITQYRISTFSDDDKAILDDYKKAHNITD